MHILGTENVVFASSALLRPLVPLGLWCQTSGIEWWQRMGATMRSDKVGRESQMAGEKLNIFPDLGGEES